MKSKKYKEIHKLKKMLEDADIPFDWIEGWGYGTEERKLLNIIAPDKYVIQKVLFIMTKNVG